MDQVRIEQLEALAVIGVCAFEHRVPQLLIIDLELETNFNRAFGSDDLKDVLDYYTISQMVRTFCKESRYSLLETLAGGIIEMIQEKFNVDQLSILIRKPDALQGAIASVWCKRTKQEMSRL